MGERGGISQAGFLRKGSYERPNVRKVVNARAARRVLAREPTHEPMRRMETDCLAKLREDPDRLAPPPRPRR